MWLFALVQMSTLATQSISYTHNQNRQVCETARLGVSGHSDVSSKVHEQFPKSLRPKVLSTNLSLLNEGLLNLKRTNICLCNWQK